MLASILHVRPELITVGHVELRIKKALKNNLYDSMKLCKSVLKINTSFPFHTM